ncbi:uncharacterized protein LOC129945128 [Eupeodes corollae]|uniref:uncharacterized protein LOC129945128 n=1 Tax=Eupeodes corollae TaxID=290404 RepID=UPI002493369C|nr:uncharacterized protein LOC129945128 [Eupeodes corollae]
MVIDNHTYWLVSAYLGHDHQGPLPGTILEKTVAESTRQKTNLIIGCDANAHHTTWGCTDLNNRGESLFDYILTTNLVVSYEGSEPTFISKNRLEVLDLTLVSLNLSNKILNWRVSKENSFSDQRYIQFTLIKESPKPIQFGNYTKTDWPKYRATMNDFDLIKLELSDPPLCALELEQRVDELTAVINKAMETACFLTAVRGKKKPYWWAAELETLRKDCRRVFNRAKKTR